MCSLIFAFILILVVQSHLAEKSGSCPPPTQIEVCGDTCINDGQCEGNTKCCPTACGGAVCTKPVTQREIQAQKVKVGYCPEPSGPWVCSNTCTLDTDCRGRLKCCKNRCGALKCTKPQLNYLGDDRQ